MIKRKKSITYKGETAKVATMSWKYGVPIRTLLDRLASGWTDAQCIEGKEGRSNSRSPTITITYAGLTATLNQWAKRHNVSVHTLTSRYRRGWAVEEILFGKT